MFSRFTVEARKTLSETAKTSLTKKLSSRTLLTTHTTNTGLFRYLSERLNCKQVIVVESKTAPLEYSSADMAEFAKGKNQALRSAGQRKILKEAEAR